MFGLNFIAESDLFSFRIAKFYSSKNRTYKARQGITLDTCSIHSNGDEIGFRFYYRMLKAKNDRHAIYAESIFSINGIRTQIEDNFIDFCNNLADDSVEEILTQIN